MPQIIKGLEDLISDMVRTRLAAGRRGNPLAYQAAWEAQAAAEKILAAGLAEISTVGMHGN